jgi:hypothetical protein
VSLRIYGQYIPENSSSLNICKLFTRDYQVIFEKLLYLFQRIVVSSQAADSASAGGAGKSQKTEELIVKAQRLILEISDSLDEKFQEEREKQVLLAVQSQCSFSPPPFLFLAVIHDPKIFTPKSLWSSSLALKYKRPERWVMKKNEGIERKSNLEEVLAEEEEEATEDEGSPDTDAEATGGELWSQSARNTRSGLSFKSELFDERHEFLESDSSWIKRLQISAPSKCIKWWKILSARQKEKRSTSTINHHCKFWNIHSPHKPTSQRISLGGFILSPSLLFFFSSDPGRKNVSQVLQSCVWVGGSLCGQGGDPTWINYFLAEIHVPL